MFGKDGEGKTASGINLVSIESLVNIFVMMLNCVVERNDLMLVDEP
jgi:hypothetical protein